MFLIGRRKLSLICLAALILAGCATIKADPISPSEIFLVRHAEKASGPDPVLTRVGEKRAEDLADRLVDVGITHIYSSDYRRTRQTAAPLAARLGLTVEIYDPSDLPGFAAELGERDGRYLVVGHSNATPQLVELLGGEGGTPIVEATEYDRLYHITRAADGAVSSVLLRYGETQPNR